MLINVLNAVFVLLVIFSPASVFRGILVAPFLLVLPGYALLLAVFPGKGDISGVERVVLTGISSVAVVVIAGLFLDQTSLGVRLEPVVYTLAGLTALVSLATWARLWGREKGERFRIKVDFGFLRPSGGVGSNLLTVGLVVLILGSLTALGFVAADPSGERYTEFYALGEQNTLGDYISGLAPGEEGVVTLGIVNHEDLEIDYFIEPIVAGTSGGVTGPFTVKAGETWEGRVTFRAVETGRDQEVRFLLYRNSPGEPYKSLHIWIDVVE